LWEPTKFTKKSIKNLIRDRLVLKKEAAKCLIYKENKVG
jgi:hypothetical protein